MSDSGGMGHTTSHTSPVATTGGYVEWRWEVSEPELAQR